MPDSDAIPDPAAVILRTLTYLQEVKGVKPNGIHVLYARWCDGQKITADASRETVRKWCNGEARPTKPGSFYAFAQTVGKPTPKGAVNDLTRAVRELFPSGDDDDTSKLSRLHGHFEIVRRNWTNMGSGDCLRCAVSFNHEAGQCLYTEEEKFTSRHPVDEKYTGYTFLFGTSFWIIAHEDRRQSIKFLTIHECVPPLTAEMPVVNKCLGNLIAVSGKGPNYGHPFVLIRTKGKETGCRIMSREQTRAFLDKEDYLYLYGTDEKTQEAPIRSYKEAF